MKTNSTDIGVLLLRVSFSLSLMVIHGWAKTSMALAGNTDFPDPLHIGSRMTLILLMIAEFFCPILVIIGWKVRLAVIPIWVAMMVALTIFHAGDPFADRELAYVYAAAYTAIYFLGAGKYSLEYLMSQAKKK